jgi:hypothetical protein
MSWYISYLEWYKTGACLTVFRLALRAHPASYPTGTGEFPPGIKRPGREADHSPPSSVEVENAWSYTSTPTIRLHGVVFSKAQEQLHIYFLT